MGRSDREVVRVCTEPGGGGGDAAGPRECTLPGAFAEGLKRVDRGEKPPKTAPLRQSRLELTPA